MPSPTRPKMPQAAQITPEKGPDTGPEAAQMIAQPLERWFGLHRRKLPWRELRTPYRTWLSEIMLQQTQVTVVIEYFDRFTQRFPDVHALAQADLDNVLSLWSGLGYYARGRNLHKAAQVICKDHDGTFPSDLKELLALPGVGPYTAGAIASLAFGQRVPVLDGNVARVLSRLFDDDTPIDSSLGQKQLWQKATDLVQAAAEPADLNEGLMELGALICTPRSPSCTVCPLRSQCRAQHAGTVEALPKKKPKAARKKLRMACAVIVHEEHIWLERDEGNGLFGGLYAPPSIALKGRASVKQAVRRLLADRQLEPPKVLNRIHSVQRTLTHRLLTLDAIVVSIDTKTASASWRHQDSLQEIGLSSAVTALLREVWPPARHALASNR